MANVKIKEVKAEWENKSLCEVRGFFEERCRGYEYDKERINEAAQAILDMGDLTNERFVSRVSDKIGDLNFLKSDLKWEADMIKALKPILDKKIAEEQDQEKLNEYLNKNAEQIAPLVEKVADIEAEALNQIEGFWSTFDSKTIKDAHRQMLNETIYMLMGRIGNMTEVCRIDYNPNKGFDGCFIGDKGRISINTIIAGGYNIQKAHYRTLVYNC